MSKAVIFQSNLVMEKKIVDFQERPICQHCKIPLSVCSHSTPSSVIGFEGPYYTEYVEYTCTNKDCSQYRKEKFRAPNPWRVDRHKCDLEVEAWIVQQRVKEKKTYGEIKNKLEINHGIKISDKTIGNIIMRYEVSSKLGNKKEILNEFKKNGGIFIGVDTMASLKGEDKHIVAIDHYTNRTLLVERVKSENTKTHIKFQRKLKKLTKQNKIKVLGIMSDDHRAQRIAIKVVWGSKMKHCRCLFHFKKRIMKEAFNLNRGLKKKAKSRIRKIIYIKNFREDKLISIKSSKVWDYLYDIIKDLVAFQTWKNKRNDTDLESIIFYERLQDIYRLLIDLKEKISLTPQFKYRKEKKRLKVLLRKIKGILDENKQAYNNLLIIKGYQDKLREIFDAHEEPSEVGLKKLTNFAHSLEKHLYSNTDICEEEKYFIEELCSFVFDRGESLFQYRDIKNADNTNNNQEDKFKTVKRDIRRTQGSASASQYLQAHAKYMLFVDPNASIEEIKKILMNADYKEVARIMKEDRALRRRPLSKIKNKKKWESRKEKFKKKLQEI